MEYVPIAHKAGFRNFSVDAKISSSNSYTVTFYCGWISLENEAYCGQLDINGWDLRWYSSTLTWLCVGKDNTESHNPGDVMILKGMCQSEIKKRHPILFPKMSTKKRKKNK